MIWSQSFGYITERMNASGCTTIQSSRPYMCISVIRVQFFSSTTRSRLLDLLDRPTIGAFRVSPGRIERHAVTNLSDTSSDFLRVELKQVPLNNSLKPFRGKAPESPLHNSRAIEYRAPELDVQRIICEQGTPCHMAVSASPSLLIAFSPLKIVENDAAERGELMKNGDVRWVRDSHAVSMVAASDTLVHLLLITLKAQQ
jgi:hypothetical protein